jgi:glycerol dehydrogenase
VLDEAGEYVAPWGDRALISSGRNALAATEERLLKSLARSGITWREYLFTGECCPENISKIKKQAEDFGGDVVIGVGGGKSLDTAKAAATELCIPAICIPTIAATCAATTALSVIYDERGIFQKALVLPNSPSLVLVDPGIIANAPDLYLRSGILDSISKWYEGRSLYQRIRNPSVQTCAAIRLAEVLYEGLRRHALDAVRLISQRKVEDSLIQTLDLILYLTGLIQSLGRGTLLTGLAHCIHNGMTLLKESHRVLHGIKVGYGIIVQLSVEKCPKQEFDEVVSFFRQLGLEPSLKALNLPCGRHIVMRIAEKAANDPDMGPLAYPVNKELIASAMEELERKFSFFASNRELDTSCV